MRKGVAQTLGFWLMVAQRAWDFVWVKLEMRGIVIATLLAFVVALFVFLSAQLDLIPHDTPIVGEVINNSITQSLTALCAIGIFVLMVVLALVYVPSRIHEEQNEEIVSLVGARHRAEQQLKKLDDSRPQIVFHKYREGPQYLKVGAGDTEETATIHYRLLQIWFRNQADNPTEDAIARNVSAEIEFWDREGKEKLFDEVRGQWAETRAPNWISPETLGEGNPRIDMEPGYSSYKLMVALKFIDEEECYPYALEHFGGSYAQSLETYGRNPKMALPKGSFRVRVRLLGINVKEEFKFELTNPGSSGNMELVEVIRM